MTKTLVWLFFHAVIPLSPVMIVKVISWLQRAATKKIFEIIKNGNLLLLHGTDFSGHSRHSRHGKGPQALLTPFRG